VDIGIYYDAQRLDIHALNHAAQTADDDHRPNLVTAPGGWGEWVNGGGWLVIGGCPVDWILRDTVRVEKVIRDGDRGIVTAHYQTGHPHAYINIMYRGELAVCRVLWDKDGKVSALKKTAERYPHEMRKALLQLFLFEAEFSCKLAEKSADQDDSYYVAAHAVRSLSALNQVLFALNHQYCLNEKKAVRMIETFAIHPVGYKEKVDALWRAFGTDPACACEQLRRLVNEVKELAP